MDILTVCLIFMAASLWARKDLNLRAPATLPTAYKTEGILARAGSERGHRTPGLPIMSRALCRLSYLAMSRHPGS
jgi:hypothetical protein